MNITNSRPMRGLRNLTLATLAFALTACKVETVPYVDIERYMGLWYQISAYETFFNEGLVGVTAEYTLLEDGSVQVYNKGFKDSLDGPIDEILGNAVVIDKETNSKLKVSFPGAPDFPWANYLIIILDEGYQYAVVTDPFQNTLFVLSRTPKLADETYEAILTELEAMDIDTEKLLETEQPMYF